MKRRRFLTLTAAALTLPRAARATVWQGTALGADVSITLTGPGASDALTQVRHTLTRMETLFSLYAPSVLLHLNAHGTLQSPPAEFGALMRIVDDMVRVTGGCFDPTVQPLWAALASGGDVDAARSLIGWDHVTIAADVIRMAPGQAMTLNGIAQGFATDIVTEELKASGFDHALINIGEYRALGGPFHLAVEDPNFGALSRTTLTGGAVATSSPDALHVGGLSHVLSARGTPPHWSTVTVTARTAAVADALSTGFCLMTSSQIRDTLQRVPGTTARLIDRSGNLITA